MNKIKKGDTFVLNTYFNGDREMARVLEVQGRVFKSYLCAVWGEKPDGKHDWPNGNVRFYQNVIQASELVKGTKLSQGVVS